ncbi:MAG: M23 family metallopeptidase [Actinobacteria bacterium]|nr:M23 family metallopeptidase [Actinomycetota bacterium]
MLIWRIPKRNLSLLARASALVAVSTLLGAGSHHPGVAGRAAGSPDASAQTSTDPVALAIEELRRRPPRASRSSEEATGAPSLRPSARPSAAFRDPKPARSAKVRPVPGAVTGLFGEIRGGGRPHGGVDLDGEIGDPVVSAGAGLVVHAGPPPPGMSGYGNTVVVNHPDGTYAMYAHLSAVQIAPGTVVEAGAHLGAVGVSGSVTGSHLHWEMRIGEVTIDPLLWLASG